MLTTVLLATSVAVATVSPVEALPRRQADDRVVEASTRRSLARPVTLKTRDRIRLAASFYPPTGRGRAPGAVLVHDAGEDRAQLGELALALHKRGFGVLTVDLRAHGESATEESDWTLLDDDDRVVTWAFAERDVAAAAIWLSEQPAIHSSNLTVVGVGAGCGPALKHAEDDLDVRSTVLVAPPAEAYGIDVARGVADLAGLPCLILIPRAEREVAESMQESAREANDGLEFVEVQVLSSDPEEVLEDKRLATSAGKWAQDRAEDG